MDFKSPELWFLTTKVGAADKTEAVIAEQRIGGQRFVKAYKYLGRYNPNAIRSTKVCFPPNTLPFICKIKDKHIILTGGCAGALVMRIRAHKKTDEYRAQQFDIYFAHTGATNDLAKSP